MATTRLFAFNTGSTIPGTTQVGNLAIGIDDLRYDLYPGGVIWYMGPDESLGYIIALPVPERNQPEFYQSEFTDSSFLGITPEYRTNILEEIFLLTYYHKGGITRDEVYKMTISERRWEIQRISDEIEKKNKAEEDAYRKAQSKR